jgi:hypothetical protein
MLKKSSSECQDIDHPALLQVQEPFARILFPPSTSLNSDSTINKSNMNPLQGCSGDHCTLNNSAFSKSTTADAFCKGARDASRFLPRDNGFIREDQQLIQTRNHRVIKKRHTHNRDGDKLEEEVCRSSKAMIDYDGRATRRDMFDEMMLRGCETCIKDMEKLRISKADEAMSSKNKKGDVVDLCALLIICCAQAVAAGNVMMAQELLGQMKQHASPAGDG